MLVTEDMSLVTEDMVLFNKILKKRSICYNHQYRLIWCHPKMDQLVIVAIILETIVLSKMCLVLLVTAFKVGFQKNLEKNAVLLPHIMMSALARSWEWKESQNFKSLLSIVIKTKVVLNVIRMSDSQYVIISICQYDIIN